MDLSTLLSTRIVKEHVAYFGGAERVPINDSLIVHFKSARNRFLEKAQQEKTEQEMIQQRLIAEREAAAAKNKREKEKQDKLEKQNAYQVKLDDLDESIQHLEDEDNKARQKLMQDINVNVRIATQSKSNGLRLQIASERAKYDKVLKEYLQWLKSVSD